MLFLNVALHGLAGGKPDIAWGHRAPNLTLGDSKPFVMCFNMDSKSPLCCVYTRATSGNTLVHFFGCCHDDYSVTESREAEKIQLLGKAKVKKLIFESRK